MLAILLTILLHGHHYGWQQPHNPHRQSCAVVFHLGCASVDPPPHIITPPPPVPFPVPR